MGGTVDEVDLALLDALHLNPRVSFEELGRVLDVSPVTAARRWHRLVSTGRAWVSSAIGPRLPARGALVEAECEPGAAQSLAIQLATKPQVFSVNITTGQDNLYALLVAADQPLLSELLIDVLPAMTGVRRIQSAQIVQMFSGTRWRLGGLTSEQVHAVSQEPPKKAPPHRFDDLDRALFLALQRDGRLSFRELAAAVACPEATARRRMDVLVRSGSLAFRTDFARVEAGWVTPMALKLRVDGSAVAEVGRALVRYPEVRFCAAIVGGGPANLFVTLQLHELSDFDAVIDRLLSQQPGISVLDARIVLRSVKSWGRLLDLDGHATEVVPVDLWAHAREDADTRPG